MVENLENRFVTSSPSITESQEKTRDYAEQKHIKCLPDGPVAAPSGIVRHSTCWLMPPWGQGEPVEVEATPDVLTPLMVAGYSQCVPPANTQEVTTHVDD